MAYSRIYIGVHYPLDIFCGALFGVFSGWLWFKICNYFKNENSQITILRK